MDSNEFDYALDGLLTHEVKKTLKPAQHGDTETEELWKLILEDLRKGDWIAY